MVASRMPVGDMQPNGTSEEEFRDVDGMPTSPPAVKRMRGSVTPDQVEKLIASGLYPPGSLRPTLSKSDPAAEQSLAIVVYDPAAISAFSVRAEGNGVSRRKKYLPTPPGIRDCPPGMRIRGGRMMPPARQATSQLNEKQKKILKRKIDPADVTVLSDSDSGAEKRDGRPSHHSIKPVTRAGSDVPTKLKKQKVHAQQQGGTIGKFNPDVDELKPDADPRVKVRYFLKQFDNLRRRFVAQEEGRVKDGGSRPKRPDVGAFQALKEFRNRVNGDETIYGEVPGVEVGDHYYYRTELLLISLHKQSQGGIDYITKERSEFRDSRGDRISVAVSVIASGGYEDDLDQGNVLIYTGQGGNLNIGNKREAADQEMVRGNLALRNCCELGLSVRVIRGCNIKKSQFNQSPSGKIYYYDGLYDVKEFYAEKGAAGCKVWKFKLVRMPGQGELSSNLVLFRGKSLPPVLRDKGERVIAEDLSQGLEPFKVRVVGCEDEDGVPNNFEYITSLRYSPRVPKPSTPEPCTCSKECSLSIGCKCIALNGDHPYNDEGSLLKAKRLVYECGPQCRCPAAGKCTNRVVQKGLRYELEVFKTKGKGWGVRSSDFIPQGSFVCEYIGEIIHDSDAEKRVCDDEYMFDLRIPENMKRRFGHISGMGKSGNSSDDEDEDDGHCEKYTVDANRIGNLARFINHSCEPNLFVQCVLHDHHDHRFPHITLFASEHIAPYKELTYDYGYEIDTILDKDGKIKKKKCFCGSRNCSGRMY